MRTSKNYKVIDFPPLTERQKAELEVLNSMPDSDIDYSDIPKQTNQDFERGHLRSWKPAKNPVSFRIDLDNNVKRLGKH